MDPKRVNEFGTSGEDHTTPPTPQSLTAAENSPDKREENEQEENKNPEQDKTAEEKKND